ncbi:MAG: 4-phosphoerythronate dehydrogenase [Pseudomonadota bacterium]|nr:4-phosphoerythronate dehydrogenase [Pseudomonadota bacterium]
MRLVVDENLAYVEHFFAEHCLKKVAGRCLIAQDLVETDALLVRSVTQVTADLVKNTPIGFVGSATIGTDHLDLVGLAAQQITVANAAGCNAQAVAEYVVTAILTLRPEVLTAGQAFCLGVVGLGNVGTRLARLAGRLGWRVLGYDPLQSHADIEQVNLPELLAQANAVSLHVPMTRTGDYPTYHLLAAAELAQMSADCLLINTARGAVVAEADLLADIQQTGRAVVLDVFEHEPRISAELLTHLALVTPHVAGYSLEGKARGTEMIYQAFCDWQNLPAPRQMAEVMPAAACYFDQRPLVEQLLPLLPSLYDIRRDDAVLRACVHEGWVDAASFDQLRRDYPLRREWAAYGDQA